MATPDVPAAAHDPPCDGIFCAPGGVLVGWSAEPPVLEADVRADERARVLDAVQSSSLAQRFQETYERLAPDFGYRTREASAKPWDDVPEQNLALMIATCAEIIQHLRDTVGASECRNTGWV